MTVGHRPRSRSLLVAESWYVLRTDGELRRLHRNLL